MPGSYGSVLAPFAATWVATGPASGTATTPYYNFPAFSVSLDGYASGNLAWDYGSTFLSPLISLVLDGTAAGIYFDRAHSGPGTPGSGPGQDIVFGDLYPPGIDASFVVTYASTVALNGNPPDNDLYAKLTVTFPSNFIGGFNFTQDTDRNVVPEPASWLLIGTGLAATLISRAAGNKSLARKCCASQPRAGSDAERSQTFLFQKLAWMHRRKRLRTSSVAAPLVI